MKKSIYALGAVALFLSIASSALAVQVTPNDSIVTPQPFSFYCDPYVSTFLAGQAYIPSELQNCYFIIPETNQPKLVAIYQGTIGSSTFAGSGNDLGYFTTADQGFTMAGTIFGVNAHPGDPFFAASADNDINAADNYLEHGGALPVDSSISTLAWYWGTPTTVTADNQSITQGDALPSFTSTISGFINGDTLATSGITGTAACSTTVANSSTPGDYPITCTRGTLSSNKYAFDTFVAGTLHIAPAPVPLTVTADNKTINQGDPLPALTATITGFINGDTLATSDVTGSAACSTTASNSNTPGDYPITCTVGTLASTQNHYAFSTFVPGVLHIAANTPPDTQPPVILITSPAKDGVYAKTDQVFLTASVTDQSPLSTTTYWFGSKQINPALPLPLSSVSTPSIQSVSVSATDSAGNAATSTVKFFVVRSTNSCLLDIVSIFIMIFRDHTFPDKVTIEQLISDCSALQHGQHGGDADDNDHGGWSDGGH